MVPHRPPARGTCGEPPGPPPGIVLWDLPQRRWRHCARPLRAVQPAISHFAGKTENEPRSRMATRRPGWHLAAVPPRDHTSATVRGGGHQSPRRACLAFLDSDSLVRFVNVAPSERDRLPHPDAGFGKRYHREAVARRSRRDDRLLLLARGRQRPDHRAPCHDGRRMLPVMRIEARWEKPLRGEAFAEARLAALTVGVLDTEGPPRRVGWVTAVTDDGYVVQSETGWTGAIDADEAASSGLEIRSGVDAQWLPADDPTTVAYLSSLESSKPREARGPERDHPRSRGDAGGSSSGNLNASATPSRVGRLSRFLAYVRSILN